MSDTELDVSSLGSADDGALVFPSSGEEEEEEDEWEDAEEEEEDEDEEEGEEERPRTSAPFLVVPDAEEAERSRRSSIAITVPGSAEEEGERVSVASSFVSTEEPPRPRRSPAAIPAFSIRDAPYNEGVVTAVEETSKTLKPPQGQRQGTPGTSPERSVTFTPDLVKVHYSPAAPGARSPKRSTRSFSPKPNQRPIPQIVVRKKVKKRKRKRLVRRKGILAALEASGDEGASPRGGPSPTRRSTKRKSSKKKKSKLDISIHGVAKFSDIEATDDEDYAPPRHLSPRSAAQYVKTKLKEASDKRKKKKRKKKKGQSDKSDKSKKKKRKGRKKRRRGKKDDFGDSEELDAPRPQKPLGPGDQHFYPTPRNLFKKRCLFSVEPKPVVCSICDGIHYRTKRNFAANIRIIANVNRALTDILNEMRNRMKKIDNNLARVKRNLDYLEEMYEGVFRKVNRLIS